jgi:tetratricopeptide (TPR) repeat protein
MRRGLFVMALAGMLTGGALWFWHLATSAPESTYLRAQAPARWIVYPRPPVPHLQAVAELPALFSRVVNLDRAPASAVIEIRACRRAVLDVNGKRIELAAGNWKRSQAIPVAAFLKAGSNGLSVAVYNPSGPPALWLRLKTEGEEIVSDRTWKVSWAGAPWSAAALAEDAAPMGKGSALAGGERLGPALKRSWPFLGLLGLLGAAGTAGAARWRTLRPAGSQPAPETTPGHRKGRVQLEPVQALLGLILLLWVCLFFHNLAVVPLNAGFDAAGHVEHIRYVQMHGGPPPAEAGWEAHQPPLYYLLAANVLNPLKLSAASFGGQAVLRGLSLLAALGQVVFCFLSLRLLFPGERSKQAVGLLLAGFLPAQFYLAHYVTNELFAASLMSATLYFALRLLISRQPSLAEYTATGLCLGLALLAKVTAMMLAPFVLGALAYKAATLQPRGRRSWLSAVLAVALCGGISAAHYLKTWIADGHPLFAATRWSHGIGWWQDPGYHTGAYFTRFGRALYDPLYSGFHSFADGVYSTLWGDSLCGGASGLLSRPPWNYNLMGAGMALALLPTALILVGAAALLVRLLRRPAPLFGLLFCVALAMGMALVHLNLTVPAYAVAKAFYGLGALVPACAACAVGWGLLERAPGMLRLVVIVLLSMWAGTSYCSYWIAADSATTQAVLGRSLGNAGFTAGETAHLNAALARDPCNLAARTFFTAALLKQGRQDEAAEAARETIRLHGGEPEGYLDLSAVLEKQGRRDAALQETERAVKVAPCHAAARLKVASLLHALGRFDDAITASREALRLAPADPEAHAVLGSALLNRAGQAGPVVDEVGGELSPPWAAGLSPGGVLLAEAIHHFQFAVTLAPDSPDLLRTLAWLRATHVEEKLRDGKQAAAMAERACRLTDYKDPLCLLTLAAAYGETQVYGRALNIATRVERLASELGNRGLAERARTMQAAFRQQKPFRDGAMVGPN